MPTTYSVRVPLDVNSSVLVTVAGDYFQGNSGVLSEKEVVARNSSVLYGSVELVTKWSVLVPLVLLIAVTVVGNGAVIIMFLRTKRLRNFKYNFIASLAVADFLIGCTEPVSLLETMAGRWPHSPQLCKVFLVLRSSLYYISFLSILLVSVDRWCSIYHPFSYRVKQSKRLAIWTIVITWIISLVIHGTPILVWDYFDQHSTERYEPQEGTNNSESKVSDRICSPPYRSDVAFLALSVVLENVLPLVALAVLNLSVYVKILRRKSSKIRRSLSTTDNFFYLSRKSSSDSETGLPDEERDTLHEILNEKPRAASVYKPQARRHSVSNTLFHSTSASKWRVQTHRRVSFDATILSQQLALRKRSSSAAAGGGGSRQERRRSTGDELLRDLFLRQDKKAACALGLLVVVFVVCWTPHCVVSILRASCFQCVPEWVVLMTHWILAINSALNPFLYAIGNSEFRKVLTAWTGCESKELSRNKDNSNVLNNSYYLLVS